MIQKIGVYGGGPAVTDLTLLIVQRGLSVLLVEKEKETLDRSIETIRQQLDRLVSQGKVIATDKAALIGRIQLSLDIQSLMHTELVFVDCASSDAEVVGALFKELDAALPPQVVLASTSSTVAVTKLASVTQNPHRVAGMHWIIPVAEANFVEVIRGVQTDRESLKRTQELADQLNLKWVPSHDFPGYLVHRILAPMINDAVTALYEGIGSADDIDQAMQLGAKQGMGPLAMADAVGLDKVLAVLENLHRSLGNPKFAPCPLLVKYVEAGYLGRKTGKGFYEYKTDELVSQPPAENRNVA